MKIDPALFEQIFAGLPDVVSIQDRNFRILYQNDAARDFAGSHAGEECFRIYEGQDQICADCGIAQVFATGKPALTVRTLTSPDGSVSFWENSCFPLFDAAGEIVAGVEVCRNITERKLVEEALFFVAQRGWETGSDSFLNALALFLGERLNMDLVIIGRLDDSLSRVETLALNVRGTIAPNLGYLLKGTPCENVIGAKLCVYLKDIQQLFQDDPMLAEMGVESYIGIPLWDSAGQAIGLIAMLDSRPLVDSSPAIQVLQLIATRVAAELERERSDHLQRVRAREFRTLAENSPDNISRYDINCRTVYVNPALEKTLGIPASTILGTTPVGSPRIDKSGTYQEHLANVLATGESSEMDLVMPDRGEGERFHNIRFVAERGEDGTITGVLAIGRDITERKQIEENLRKLSQAIEQSPVSIVITDTTGRIEFVNRKFSEVSGYSREEVMGKNPRILKSGYTSEAEYEALWQTVSTGDIWSGEFQNRKKNGELFWEHATIASVRDPHQRITHYVAVREDITERKRLEEQLRQVQKLESVGQLAGGVAHDFNNMLAVILGRTELALRKVTPDDPLFVSLQEIHKAAERSADLTRQLLAFARKQFIKPRVLDLNKALEGMLAMLRRLIGEDINLAWLPSKDPLPVKMDPVQIDQILANLCINARDAIIGAGKITIETQQVVFSEKYCDVHVESLPGEYVLLAVSDDGCGMDKATLERIFEPFFTTKQVGRGTGLGLATIYGIVRQNNGFINVYSEPGQGTTFRIYLPGAVGFSSQKADKGEQQPVAQGQETILLVEDEPSILIVAQQMLEDCGYRVLPAATPVEAVHMAKSCAGVIHLLITDVVMPEMNGRELAETLMEEYPDVKCLYMSGYPTNVIMRHGVIEQGVHFIPKPFSLEVFAATVRKILDE